VKTRSPRPSFTLASQYGRYGYRRITALLQHAGWRVGKDRVERIWSREGLKSFNSKLRDEFLDGEIFYSLKEVQGLAERWRVHYNTIRPHSSLGYRPPAVAIRSEADFGVPECSGSSLAT
jgi:transposase InsO family protein